VIQRLSMMMRGKRTDAECESKKSRNSPVDSSTFRAESEQSFHCVLERHDSTRVIDQHVGQDGI
jgi:hypothetical protein